MFARPLLSHIEIILHFPLFKPWHVTEFKIFRFVPDMDFYAGKKQGKPEELKNEKAGSKY